MACSRISDSNHRGLLPPGQPLSRLISIVTRRGHVGRLVLDRPHSARDARDIHWTTRRWRKSYPNTKARGLAHPYSSFHHVSGLSCHTRPTRGLCMIAALLSKKLLPPDVMRSRGQTGDERSKHISVCGTEKLAMAMLGRPTHGGHLTASDRQRSVPASPCPFFKLT